jgi:hypothetical protein
VKHLKIFFFVLSVSSISYSAHAQFQPITSATTTITDGADSSSTAKSYGFVKNSAGWDNGTENTWTLNYAEQRRALASVTTASATYNAITGLSNNVFVRRNSDVTVDRNAWFALNGTGGTAATPGSAINNTTKTVSLLSRNAASFTSLDTIFSSNDMNIGVDNLFSNDSADTNLNYSNVERIDIIFPGGITVRDALGFNIFERHATGVNHEGFTVAAITSLGNITVGGTGYTNAPLSWGALKTSTNADYGADMSFASHYATIHDTVGSGTGLADKFTFVNDQQLGGVFIPSTNLATSGATIYGFTIFAADTPTIGYTPATSGNWADWSNTTNYPKTSTGAANNGIDPVSTMGAVFTSDGGGATIPEPSVIVLLLIGLPFFTTARNSQYKVLFSKSS